tara:strand:- start:694 stop:1866 length:1173 start_codon:yes stop_codon:yes gene_type:complete
VLTNQFAFQPEDIIEIDGVIYAVYLDTDEELGDFPILAKVDNPNFLAEGVVPTSLDATEFAAKYGYAYRGHEDLLVSEILTGDEQEPYRGVFDAVEAKFQSQAQENGMKWLLDRDVQAAFLAASLTGVPVSVDDLSGTVWYNSSSENERKFMVKYYSDPDSVQKDIATNIANISKGIISRNMKGPINELANAMALAVTTFQIDADEVDTLLDYLDDETYLNLLGGKDLLPEILQPFVGKFTGVNTGQATTKGFIVDILGVGAYDAMVQSGAFTKLAARVRAGDVEGVKNELQMQHDTLYPMFKGSNYGTWNGYYSNRASRVINGVTGNQIVQLTPNQKDIVDDLIVKANGDYMEFDKLVRGSFIDSPGLKNQFLDDLASRVPQAYSGVFG